MWTRKELKAKGKKAFYGSYWKHVLVAIITSVVVAGAASGGSSGGISSSMTGVINSINNIGASDFSLNLDDGLESLEDLRDELEDEFDSDIDIRINNLPEEVMDSIRDELKDSLKNGVAVSDDEIMISDDDEIRINRDGITIGEDKVVINKDGIFVDGRIAADSDGIVIENDGDNSIVINGNNISVNGNNVNIDKAAGFAIAGVAIAIAIVVGVIALIVGVFSIALDLFVFKPIEYGCRKFFKEAHSGNPRLSLIFSGFTDGYMNIVKVLFFRDLFIFLWSLLFIIPGIVKSYEYRMVPYLLSENPKMSKDEATKLSSRMMKGNKWKAFVLDLSFIGWHILSALTMDILGIFYVKPYQQATNAALYLALKEEDPDGFPVGGSTPGEDTPAIAAE